MEILHSQASMEVNDQNIVQQLVFLRKKNVSQHHLSWQSWQSAFSQSRGNDKPSVHTVLYWTGFWKHCSTSDWSGFPQEHFPTLHFWGFVCFYCLFCFVFSRQGFPVALMPDLKVALVDQAGLKLPEIHLPLPPKCWVWRCAPPLSGPHMSFKVVLFLPLALCW